MTPGDAPRALRACWLSWVAPAKVITHLGVTNLRQISWANGAELIDEIARSETARLSTMELEASSGDGGSIPALSPK